MNLARELESAVSDAMWAAFSDVDEPGREFSAVDIVRALRKLSFFERRTTHALSAE